MNDDKIARKIDGENNRTEMSARRKVMIAVVSSLVGISVISLVLATNSGQMQISTAERQVPSQKHEISSANQTSENGFFFNICGEETDPSRAIGTGENPAIVKKQGPPTTVHLCIRNTNQVDRTWTLEAVDPMDMNKLPAKGLNVKFDKTFIHMPKYNGKVSDFANGKGDKATLDVSVKADKSAETGSKGIMILAKYPIEPGYYQAFGYSIVVEVQDK